jgi:hypothetical protein
VSVLEGIGIEDFREFLAKNRWPSIAREFLEGQKPAKDVCESFSTHWIESGHRIREQLLDDRLLVRLLRHLLPPYKGPTIKLFRGENIQRLNVGKVGMAWSSDIKVARMFGQGWNSVPDGGVLLCAEFEPVAIISGPVGHTGWLGEDQFTVDPFMKTGFQTMEHYPES